MKKYLAVFLLLAVLLIPTATKAQDLTMLASLLTQLQHLVAQLAELKQTAQTYPWVGRTPPSPTAVKLSPGVVGLIPTVTPIRSWADLNAIRFNTNQYGMIVGDYILEADLSASTPGYETYAGPTANVDTNGGSGWLPLGGDSAPGGEGPFTGTFDGNGNIIADLYINRPGKSEQGLFSRIIPYNDTTFTLGTVKNLKLEKVNITGEEGIGALAALTAAPVINVSSSGRVSGKSNVGGLVGLLGEYGVINRSHSSVNVFGDTNEHAYRCCFGGLVGAGAGIYDGVIRNSYATGRVIGNHKVGGLSGGYLIQVFDSYATGDVSGISAVGGLAGRPYSVTNSYSTGRVSGTGQLVGGLIGDINNPNRVSNSYWDTQTSGRTTSAGGVGEPTARLTTVPRPSGIFTGWNFGTDGPWIQTNGSYPTLR